MLKGGIIVRGFDESRKDRGIREVELFGLLAEVEIRRRAQSEATVTEIDGARVSLNSFSLRLMVFSCERWVFLMSCWEMVEAPSLKERALAFFKVAFAMRLKSKPRWL